MKKSLLTIMAMFAIATVAVAEDYNVLRVVEKNYNAVNIPLSGIRKITFEGVNMVITDKKANRSSMPLEGLAKMFFAYDITPVDGVKADGSTVESVYTIDGRLLSEKRTEALRKGLYILKKTDGTTVKTVLP